jgi:hypothetical protein
MSQLALDSKSCNHRKLPFIRINAMRQLPLSVRFPMSQFELLNLINSGIDCAAKLPS